MKKLGLLFLVFALCCSASFAATGRYRLSWRADPTTTMVIGWHQNGGSNPVVHYGTVDQGANFAAYPDTKGVDRTVTVKGLDTRFARLTGLTPDTVYYFVVRDSSGTGPRMSFRTAPATPKPFTFIAGGDSRNTQSVRQNGNRLVAKLRPLFVLFGGDYTADDTNAEWNVWLDDWQLTRSTDGRMYPIIAQRGNHDNADVEKMFDMPSTQAYFALSVVPNFMRVYTLNTEITPGGSQGSWLVSDLQANQSVTWKIMSYHRETLPTTSTKTSQQDQFDAWNKHFYTYGVNLAVESDSHLTKVTYPVRPNSTLGYTRDDAKGTVYIGAGCWGAPLREADRTSSWHRATSSSTNNTLNMFHLQHVYPDYIETRVVEITSTSGVGTVSDSAPMVIPSGLKIWAPSTGSVVRINPIGGTPPPAQVATPTFSLLPGTYPSAVTVNISSATSGSAIRYSLNNGAWVAAGNPASVTISATSTLRAVATKSGLTDSAERSGTYTINTTPPTTTYYKIKLVNNPSLLLSIASAPANGVNVQVNTDTGDDRQLWRVVDLGDGYVRILPKLSDTHCLQCSTTAADGVNVQLYDFASDNTRKQWQMALVSGSSTYKVAVRASLGFVLDCASVAPFSGSNVQMWTYAAGNNRQQWIFEAQP
jgi:hypothetical protein